ncbi:MAG: hypothetical protein HYY30_14520, partial [Chloroflexi bacterium]|nr:hypothetical protein [Chloroflexota bacterium]
MGNLGSFWIVAPILVLAVGFLAVLLSTGLANRQLPPMVGVLPTIVSLAMTFALYLETSDAPLTLTLFAWESGSDQSIALAYYVDAWAALLAVLALFLGLCAQMLLANQALDGRSRQNWAHIFILATLALLLNLFFSASLAMLYMAWVATGLVVYASIAIGSGQDRSDEGERVPSGEMRPPPEPAGSPRNPSEQRGETLRMAACIAAGYALLGSILLLTRTDGDLLGVVGLRSASFGLGASILMAFALGAYLGLYPFKPWRSCAGARPSAATMTIPLSFFPALGAFYVLGRMYPVSTGGTSSSLSTITAAMALATIVVASARAWGARELDALLVDVVSVELAFAVLAFVLAPAYGISGDGSGSIGMNAFAAGLFIFLNCVLSAQTILLGIVHLRVRQNGDTGEVSGSASPRLRTGVGSALFAAPWVSLIGLPLTMGFAAKGMLFSIGFDPARVALLLIGVVANGIIIVAALRLLDKEVAAVISRRATASHRSTGSVPAEAVGYNPDPTP